MFISFNGKIKREEEAAVSVLDHGFLYGDGVFETIRKYKSDFFKLGEHLERLWQSAKAIKLDIPATKEQLAGSIMKTAEANSLQEAVVRVYVTRGRGELGLTAKCEPRIIIMASAVHKHNSIIYEKGAKVITYAAERFMPEVKSMSYLINIIAKQQADKANAYDTLFVNAQGHITEATTSNVFIVQKNKLVTPSHGMLPGVTRAAIMALAKEFMEVEERMFTVHDIYTANECFLTSTVREIVPITWVNDKVIGTGKPGKMTMKLMDIFKTCHR